MGYVNPVSRKATNGLDNHMSLPIRDDCGNDMWPPISFDMGRNGFNALGRLKQALTSHTTAMPRRRQHSTLLPIISNRSQLGTNGYYTPTDSAPATS